GSRQLAVGSPEPRVPSPQRPAPSPQPLVIVIEPSTGFGTGHHASTRLCLAALQRIELAGRTLLDVGTGSGILAIAASRLGNGRPLGIDNDPDADDAALRNLALNPEAHGVEFRVADLQSSNLPPADVVTANLTGTLIERSAPRLLAALQSNGQLLLTALLLTDRQALLP